MAPIKLATPALVGNLPLASITQGRRKFCSELNLATGSFAYNKARGENRFSFFPGSNVILSKQNSGASDVPWRPNKFALSPRVCFELKPLCRRLMRWGQVSVLQCLEREVRGLPNKVKAGENCRKIYQVEFSVNCTSEVQ